jgi:hypothetical protein
VQAAALRPASLERLVTHLVAEHGAAEELRVTPRTLIRRLSFLTQDEKDHLASLSPGVLDKLAEATKKYRSAAQKGQIPGITGPKGPGDYIPGMPHGGAAGLPDYLFPGGGGGPWQGGSPVGPGGWAGSGKGAGGGGGGGPLGELGFLGELGRDGWTPGGGFKPGVGQKGIAPDAFGQPGGAGIRPEAFGVGRREDPHFRAVTWDVRNPGGGAMDDPNAGSGTGENAGARTGGKTAKEWAAYDAEVERRQVEVNKEGRSERIGDSAVLGAVTLAIGVGLTPGGQLLIVPAALAGAGLGAGLQWLREERFWQNHHRPADDGTGPVGPRSSAYRPADDGTGPVGPRLAFYRPADDGTGPIGPWAHTQATAGHRWSSRWKPNPDSSDPGSPRSHAAAALLAQRFEFIALDPAARSRS